MEVVCNDPIFGKMSYKHRWFKQDKFYLFGADWTVSVVARAYSGRPITDRQRESYKRFIEQMDLIADDVSELIMEHVNSNCEEFAAAWPGARMVNCAEDLQSIVRPTSLVFNQDGSVLILFDCVWDEEHGLGVQVFPDYKIGSQDVFL